MRNLKISIKNLEKSFKEKKILKNLSLDIFESESLSIIGESGSESQYSQDVLSD